MSQTKWPLFYACFICCIFSLFSSAFVPSLRLNYLAALIAFSTLNTNFYTALWPLASCALAIDLFSSTILGFHSLIGILTLTAIFYLKHFFKNSAVNLFILTLASSVCLSVLQIFFYFLFEKSFPLTLKFWATDVLLLSFLDGIFALSVLLLPVVMFKKAKRKLQKIRENRQLKKEQKEEKQAKEEKKPAEEI